jgi:outer membrane protein assembly factor BamB
VDGTVYVQISSGTGSTGTALWALDAASGATRWSAPFVAPGTQLWSTTVVGPAVYIAGGPYGGMYGFRTVDGSQLFFNRDLPQCDSWSPAFYQGVLYTWVQGEFVADDPATGSLLWNNEIRGTFPDYSMDAEPALADGSAYLVSPPQLGAIDLDTQDVTWLDSDSYSGTPAVAEGVVYAIDGGGLSAVDGATGAALFTFPGDGALSYPPVVANGVVYVASASNVYAIDTATHAQVWTAAVGGWLSLASGHLLVASPGGTLYGFALSTPASDAGPDGTGEADSMSPGDDAGVADASDDGTR